MNAKEILKKHEAANEMHFHEVDRKWIIDAMEEYAALRQPPVSGRSEQLSDSFEEQIKRGELDPYSPHAKWIKP